MFGKHSFFKFLIGGILINQSIQYNQSQEMIALIITAVILESLFLYIFYLLNSIYMGLSLSLCFAFYFLKYTYFG
jgi:hypothetical protein